MVPFPVDGMILVRGSCKVFVEALTLTDIMDLLKGRAGRAYAGLCAERAKIDECTLYCKRILMMRPR